MAQISPYLSEPSSNSINIDINFEKTTLFLKQFLKNIEKRCTAFDELQLSEVEQKFFLEGLGSSVFPVLNNNFLALSKTSNNFSSQEFKIHQKFIKNELSEFISRQDAPLNFQICEKPLGYSGDYKVSNFFYGDHYPGYSTYGKLIDQYTMTLPLAVAHRNRRHYLRNLLQKLITKNKGRKMTVASLACGPAVEVFDIIENADNLNNVEFILIDAEPEAIKFIKNRLASPNIKKSEISLKILQFNILDIVRKKNALGQLPKVDLIYCAGFFDYIKDQTAKRLIVSLVDSLGEEGILVVLNVAKQPSHDVYLEMIGDWTLQQRNERDLYFLVNDLKNVRHKKVWRDFETKQNLYLIIKK